MAERRMFAKSIVLSDAFLDMPMSARCLYFTLGMFADDDGFVGSPKGIMRQCGASQDDMNILLAKRFILGFESGVIVIKHWRINNYLRNDRYQSTTYKEEIETLELDNKNAYTERGIPNIGIPSIEKDSIEKDSIDNIRQIRQTAEQILQLYHEKCPSLPKVLKLTVKRVKLVNARLKEYSIDDITKVFEKAERSEFLKHGSGTWKGADFEWILNTNNFLKIMEGNYDNKTNTAYETYKKTISAGYDFEELEREAKGETLI